MVREYDIRDEVAVEPPDRREVLHAAAARASNLLPGDHRVEVVSLDRLTRGAAVVVSNDSEATRGDWVRRALEHAVDIGGALGLLPGQPPEFVADPDYQETSGGGVAVHLQQLYKGIRIYEADETVRFDPDGRLLEVAGRAHPIPGDSDAAPTVSADDALDRAVAWIAEHDDEIQTDPFGQPLLPPTIDPATFAPRRVSGPAAQPDRTTVFEAERVDGAVPVSLLWFPVDGDLRLSWTLVLSFPGGSQWRFVVDAHEGRVLLCRSLVRSLTGQASVLLRDGAAPREDLDLPPGVDRWPLDVPDDLPAGFPDPWLVDDTTAGSNVRAIRADSGEPARGRRESGRVVFDPGDPTDDLVVNLFALNGVMHDVLYLLGFRERDGNFQVDNRGRGGRSSDAVLARVHPQGVWGTANMSTPVDGRPPEMNMGLVTATGRHTAHDGDVVIHEYTHGLTNRLVGGPMNQMALEAIQSGGMGEGWGDYFACVLNDRTTVGAWVVGRSGGIRRHAYTEDYPSTYADVGTGRFTGVHALGEVWCATLLAVNRRIGTGVGAQLVVDALKLSAANPSFLAMRDAILVAADQYAASRALSDDEHNELRHGIWEAFAKFGMGPGASTDGATLHGIVADFEVPPRPRSETLVVGAASPDLAIPDNSPSGVTSTIELAAAGVVEDLEVGVDIGHTYRGDLVVTVTSPDGAEVVLHDRTGGRADDLVTTWAATDHVGLAALRGGGVGGPWTLRVVDRAPLDSGRLRAWEVRARVAAVPAVEELETTPGLAIPDDDEEGVRSVLTAVTTGTVRRATVAVDITHTYVGDLKVTLSAPNGRAVAIHDRHGGSSDNLITTFLSDGGGVLAPFVGLEVAGDWVLHVSDRAGRDVGKLNSWRLRLER